MFLLFESVVVVEVVLRGIFSEWRIAKLGFLWSKRKYFFLVPSTCIWGPLDFCECLCVCYCQMLIFIATIVCEFVFEGLVIGLLLRHFPTKVNMMRVAKPAVHCEVASLL